MKLFKILVGFACSVVALPSLAAVHLFSTCQLNEGKTGEAAAAVVQAQRDYVRAGTETSATVEILWPFFGSERPDGTFVIHRTVDDFVEFGGNLNWLWDEQHAAAEDSPPNDAFSCTQHQVLWNYEASEE